MDKQREDEIVLQGNDKRKSDESWILLDRKHHIAPPQANSKERDVHQHEHSFHPTIPHHPDKRFQGIIENYRNYRTQSNNDKKSTISNQRKSDYSRELLQQEIG